LWLINAHPALPAHVQVFEHLLAHLESPTFYLRNLKWAGSWKEEIPSWMRLCRWVVADRRKLPRLQGLHLFDSAIQGKHPHLGHGVERHGVVAALWNRHEFCADYPPVAGEVSAGSLRYFELQGHLLASYVDSRFQLSTLEFFESYRDAPERPIAPSRTGGVGLAIRELSLNRYAGVTEQLPMCESTPDFSTQLGDLRISHLDLPSDVEDDAYRYMTSIKRYFDHFSKMQGGLKPSQTTKMGWGGGGGRARRHGFVHFIGPDRVFMEEVPKPNSHPDLDIPSLPGQKVLIDLDFQLPGVSVKTDQNLLEASGLSPAETLEEVFQLYKPGEENGRIYKSYLRRLAAESSAQGFAFDSQQLTPQEIGAVDRRANEWIWSNLGELPPDNHARKKVVAGLIVRIMQLLGQPLHEAWSIRCLWQSDSSADQVLEPVGAKLTLVITAPTLGDWTHARVLGFCLPAIMPSYKSVLPENLSEIDGDSANSFVLPDLFGLGQQLLDFMKVESSTELDGFGLNKEVARKAISDFTASFADSRITAEKISRVLPSLVTSQSGDQSLAWVLTANTRSANQPRMHYTRHSIDKLHDAYSRASKRLSKLIGSRLLAAPSLDKRLASAQGIGARFVMSMPEVKGMVGRLIDDLIRPLPRKPTQHDLRKYHAIYVCYTALYQSLDTSIRAITAPSQLFRAWDTSVLEYGPICASLSDKDTNYSDRARLVQVGERLAQQFAHYKRHIQCLHLHLKLAGPAIKTYRTTRPFFIIDAYDNFEDLTPTVMQRALKKYTGCDVPANFHRAFLSTELRRRGCSAELLDAFLGHANFGEIPYSRVSTLDYRLHLDRIGSALQKLHDEIGLRPIPSQLGFQRLKGAQS
jgi:hypothetical protein